MTTLLRKGILVLGFVMAACRTASPPPGDRNADIVTAIQRHDVVAIDAYANEVAFGKRSVDPANLDDWSMITVPFTLRSPAGEVWHLGVRYVADYFLCLLEVQHRESTCDLIARQSPELSAQCPADWCGVCCTLTNQQQLPMALRRSLVDYWKQQLAAVPTASAP
jgi:hypothetical protein